MFCSILCKDGTTSSGPATGLTYQCLQQSWPGTSQDSLPATMQAAITRAELSVGCCASAAMTVLRAAHPSSPPSWAQAKSTQTLTEALAGFLQAYASKPLPLPSRIRWVKLPQQLLQQRAS